MATGRYEPTALGRARVALDVAIAGLETQIEHWNKVREEPPVGGHAALQHSRLILLAKAAQVARDASLIWIKALTGDEAKSEGASA